MVSLEEKKQKPLKQTLGLWSATAINVGAIIGGGIFVVTGIVAGLAGSAFVISMIVAAAIALLTGGRVQATLPLEPTRGAIKNVQKRSRQLSEGRFTISEKIAIQVLKGELSLLEAIEKEEKPKRL